MSSKMLHQLEENMLHFPSTVLNLIFFFILDIDDEKSRCESTFLTSTNTQ